MKYIIALTLLFPALSFGQGYAQYFIGKQKIDSLPEVLYVSGVRLSEINADYILVTTKVPMGRQMLGGRLGTKYAEINFGQSLFLNAKGECCNEHTRTLSVSKTPSILNRLMGESIALFNAISTNGWEFESQIGDPLAFQFLFKKNKS